MEAAAGVPGPRCRRVGRRQQVGLRRRQRRQRQREVEHRGGPPDEQVREDVHLGLHFAQHVREELARLVPHRGRGHVGVMPLPLLLLRLRLRRACKPVAARWRLCDHHEALVVDAVAVLAQQLQRVGEARAGQRGQLRQVVAKVSRLQPIEAARGIGLPRLVVQPGPGIAELERKQWHGDRSGLLGLLLLLRVLRVLLLARGRPTHLRGRRVVTVTAQRQLPTSGQDERLANRAPWRKGAGNKTHNYSGLGRR